MNRASVARLTQAATLWAMLDPKGYPEEAFREAWRQALLWDEHTWGAADSVSDPDGENARSQWAYKQAFALEADKRSRELLASAFGPDLDAGGRFRVLNTLSFARTGVVAVPAGPAARGDRVTDERGRAVASQRLKDGRLVILAAAVPAFSAAAYTVGPGRPGQAAGTVSVSENVLDNGLLRAVIDPVSGTVRSLLWLERGGIELVDTTRLPGLSSYHYVPGLDPKAAVGAKPGRVSVGESGPLAASLIVESEAPGCKSLRREYRLTAGSRRLEITDHRGHLFQPRPVLHRGLAAVRAREGVRRGRAGIVASREDQARRRHRPGDGDGAAGVATSRSGSRLPRRPAGGRRGAVDRRHAAERRATSSSRPCL